MRPALALLLLAACAHIDLNACTALPKINDEKPEICVALPREDLTACWWPDDLGGTRLYRDGCFSEWGEEPDDKEMHVP